MNIVNKILFESDLFKPKNLNTRSDKTDNKIIKKIKNHESLYLSDKMYEVSPPDYDTFEEIYDYIYDLGINLTTQELDQHIEEQQTKYFVESTIIRLNNKLVIEINSIDIINKINNKHSSVNYYALTNNPEKYYKYFPQT